MTAGIEELLSDGEPEISLPPEQFYQLAKDSRRRRIIELVSENGEMDLKDIVQRIVAEENRLDNDGEISKQRYKMYFSKIYQNHVPQLTEAGLIKLGQDKEKLKPTEELEPIATLLLALDNAFPQD